MVLRHTACLLALLLAAAAGRAAALAGVGPPAQPPGLCAYSPDTQSMECEQNPSFQIMEAPKDQSAAAFAEWFQAVTRWRVGARKEAGLPSKWYDDQQLTWARTSFLQPQTMLHDRYLFDNSLERGGGEGWTVDRYLDDLDDRYGGVDSVLLWHSYPNIGVDARNQFDMLESLPGGKVGVKTMVDSFHRRGVRVLLPYNPWDQGTRNTGAPDYETMVQATIDVGADGFNGDTMVGINSSWMDTAAKLGHPLSFEPECGLANLTDLAHDVSTWGYWFFGDLGQQLNTSLAPVVSAYKFLENRHMVHISDRWGSGDGVPRTDGIHNAYFNGVGYETWENVWGLFNQISERDAFVIRAGWTILREYKHLVSGAATAWTPHAPVIANASTPTSVYVSQFVGQGQSLWLLVNRNTSVHEHCSAETNDGRAAVQVELALQCDTKEDIFFDLYSGRPQPGSCAQGIFSTTLGMQPGAVGAILRGQPRVAFLQHMVNLTSSGAALLAAMNPTSDLLAMSMDVETTPVQQSAPPGMVTVPGEPAYRYVDSGNMIEGDAMAAVIDIEFPWEVGAAGVGKAGRTHTAVMPIPSFHIDTTPVTKAAYSNWLAASGWRPNSTQNWLQDWHHGAAASSSVGDGNPPTVRPGEEKQPVVWVSRDDALAYCHAHGARLPHSPEWQLAAQGPQRRAWPWGDTFNASLVPPFSKGPSIAQANPSRPTYVHFSFHHIMMLTGFCL